MASLRAMAAATVVGVVATSGVAAAVDAAPTAAPVAPTTAEVAGQASQPALPPVTEHSLGPDRIPDRRMEPTQVTQAVRLTITGGPLRLEHEHATLSLERAPGDGRLWTSPLPPVRVVDARGTHEGWTVHWEVGSLQLDGIEEVASVPAARVRVDPGDPVVVAGIPQGIVARAGGPATGPGRTLFAAQPGWGGGTYEAGGTVSLRLPAHVAPESVVVRLEYTLS